MKNIRHYNNGTILTPHKCGTKYLNKVFDLRGGVNVINLNNINLFDFKWLIVRDPYEHLISALTSVYNNKHKTHNLNDILNRFITGLDVHWNNTFYKDMLSYSLNHSFMLVELSNLTSFVNNELKLVAPPMLNRYGTQIIYMTKDNLIDKIKTEYPSEWNTLMELVDVERTYYDLLFGRCEVYNSNLHSQFETL